MNAFEGEVGVVFQESSDAFQDLEGWFVVRAITDCRDLNAFIGVYDLFTNARQEIISNGVQVLNKTEAANIQIPLRNESSTFKEGLYSAVPLSRKTVLQNRDSPAWSWLALHFLQVEKKIWKDWVDILQIHLVT